MQYFAVDLEGPPAPGASMGGRSRTAGGAMMLKARDMRRKINGELKGKPEGEQVRIIERYVQG